MSQTLAARASSIGAALCLMGIVVGIALTATYRVAAHSTPDVLPPIAFAAPEPPLTPLAPKTNTRVALAGPVDIAPVAPIIAAVDAPAWPTAVYAAPQPTLIGRPSWARIPRDLDRFYPRGALRQSVEGHVVLDCLVATTGALACAIVSEAPVGWGFGVAALHIASEYRMLPAMRDGIRVEGRYRMVVPFDLR